MSKKKLYTKTLTLPDGTRKYVRSTSKEELERRVTELRYQMGLGIRLNDTTTFGEFAEMWYHTYKKPHLRSPNSRAATLNVLNNHILPYLTAYRLAEIKPAHIQALLNAMEGKSAALQRQTFQCLNSIFRTAVDNGLIYKSPVTATIRPGGTATAEKVPLTAEQAQRLLDAIHGTQAFCFVYLALNTGLRRGELLGLQWEDLDLNAGMLHVRHNAVFDGGAVIVSETLKTDAARRTVPLPLPLTAYLRQRQTESASDFVIPMKDGRPMNRSGFRCLWKLVTQRTVKDGEEQGSTPKKCPWCVRSLDFHVTPHLLRHTYITRLFEAGLDIKEVQYLAGHKSPDMTLRVYTHYMLEQRQKQTAQKIQQGFGPVAAAFVTPSQVQRGCNTTPQTAIANAAAFDDAQRQENKKVLESAY